jgi:MFS family permease
MSPLPFNNDGMTEARIAGDMLLSEHLSYPEDSFYVDSYSIITPVYNVLVAFSSSSLSLSTYSVSQMVIAAFSVLTVLGGYFIAFRLTNNLIGSLSTAFVLALLGTFVYLSGSAWKGALGVALLILLTVAYMNRSDRRFLVLELVVLAILPLTYHLATVLAYLFLAYLTCWSLLVAILKGRITLSHVIDALIIGIASVLAYLYYLQTSFQRLSDYGEFPSVIMMILSFSALFLLAAAALSRKVRKRGLSLAPAVGAVVVFSVFVDYFDPMFPYTKGFASNVLLIGLLYGIVVTIGWFGLERLISSNSGHRAIPLGLLLPILTLFLFALTSGFDLDGHKIFYRTFDYADVSLALGAGAAVGCLAKLRYRQALACVLTITLICSFPFGYATGTLLGDRHDSQEYEVDALGWVYDYSGPSSYVRGDERLSYNARALHDFFKDPYLPSRLMSGELSGPRVFNLLLEEWMVVGVNDYPRGHPVLDSAFVDSVLEISNVLYVGGPESNNIIIFQTSSVLE